MKAIRRWGCWVLLAACFPAHRTAGDEWFAPFEHVADYKPKGPTWCFRQFNVDWSWVARRPEQLPEFLSRADPAALAEFCAATHIDGTIVMAVPHHGYCTYETRVGTKFPGMKGDWFGRTIAELHKRRIAAFAYVTLNWNWKFMRDHLGQEFIHARLQTDGSFDSGYICLNAPGYLELVEAYTREVLAGYPIDGMRWDILSTAPGCLCTGCKDFYRQTYGEDLIAWDRAAPRRVQDFDLATTRRAVTRLQRLCKEIKPAVEIWQNGLQSYHTVDLDLGRDMDIAYNEYGDPFRLLFVRGVTGKPAAINGLMNLANVDPPAALDHRQWRLCLALGGRCYSYYGHRQTDPRSVLPGETLRAWHRTQLAPFYEMVSRIQPWLEGAVPVSHVGILFAERTRLRFPAYDRKPYVAPMEAITNAYLERSQPIEFVNALDLNDSENSISRLRLLIVPLTSGLREGELAGLRTYVNQGGNLLVLGDALRHDDRGKVLPDFALARELGVSYVGTVTAKTDLAVHGNSFSADRRCAGIRQFVHVRSTAGETLLSVSRDGAQWPLLQLQAHAKGRVAYLASLDSLELTRDVIDWLSGSPPVTVTGHAGAQVVLTHQPAAQRWVLHLISDGDYAVEVRRNQVPATTVIDHYPPQGWTIRIERQTDRLQIRVEGQAGDRLLVLE